MIKKLLVHHRYPINFDTYIKEIYNDHKKHVKQNYDYDAVQQSIQSRTSQLTYHLMIFFVVLEVL